MAKAKPEPDKRQERHRFLALQEPRITVLTDHPLAPREAYRESFALNFRMGPVFDVVRHPATRTPLAVAVYGTWGAGKTTAMKWLHALIEIWNKEKEGKDAIRVTPVWFYPWKYQTKEDVWRGLVAEVIIKSLSIDEVTVPKVVNAAKRFGLFLGRSFVHALAGLTVKVETPDAVGLKVGAELTLSSIKDILAEYREASHPEKAYLNEFENTLRSWVKDSLGESDRMIIFIDDLDRCMPEVALQVLEALKLYLNIENLIFVVGVDREVIDKLVAEHYTKLGLGADKSENYLAKMFQVEVTLDPSEGQVEAFLEEQLRDLPYWKDELGEMEQGVFRRVILELAGRNPREVKRLLNSALIGGTGALNLAGDGDARPPFTFAQGLQLFFVRKILEERFTYASLVGAPRGDRFFGAWSKIVREHEGEEGFKRSIDAFTEPVKRGERGLPEAEEEPERRSEGAKSVFMAPRPRPSSGSPEEYRELIEVTEFGSLLHILGNDELGELMRIEYPKDTSLIGKAAGAALPEGLIREAIARQHKVADPANPTKEEIAKIIRLDLTGPDISDLEPIKGLTALEWLRLEGTQVSDLEPIKGLTSLQQLDVSGTQVSDLEPIKGLTSLKVLILVNTQVSELEPVKGLMSLERLGLVGTQVSDLEPIKGLTSLKGLYLKSTQVSDLRPVKGLTSLEYLGLEGTQVSSLEPLKDLTSLQYIILRGTQVSDEQVAALKRALPKLTIHR